MSTPAVSDHHAGYFQALVPGESLNHFKNFTATSSYSALLEPMTSLVSLFATQDCWCRLVQEDGAQVAAVPAESEKTASFFVPGGITAFFGIPKIDDVRYKIAVVRAGSSNGVLNISEGA